MKQTRKTRSRIASNPVADNEPNLRKLKRLLAMPIAQRIEAVINDLVTRKDEFREIEAHDLADALGVSESRSLRQLCSGNYRVNFRDGNGRRQYRD
jgi:hypothetical protein